MILLIGYTDGGTMQHLCADESEVLARQRMIEQAARLPIRWELHYTEHATVVAAVAAMERNR